MRVHLFHLRPNLRAAIAQRSGLLSGNRSPADSISNDEGESTCVLHYPSLKLLNVIIVGDVNLAGEKRTSRFTKAYMF